MQTAADDDEDDDECAELPDADWNSWLDAGDREVWVPFWVRMWSALLDYAWRG